MCRRRFLLAKVEIVVFVLHYDEMSVVYSAVEGGGRQHESLTSSSSSSSSGISHKFSQVCLGASSCFYAS